MSEESTAGEPMEVAARFREAAQAEKRARLAHDEAKKALAPLQEQVLQLMEDGKLSTSFKCGKGNIHLHTQVWASPKESHDHLTEVLRELGMDEYLPRTVNTHSISAFVREHIDPESQEVVGLPPELEAALKITHKMSVRATGL